MTTLTTRMTHATVATTTTMATSANIPPTRWTRTKTVAEAPRKKTSIAAIAPLSPRFSCTSWSAPSKRPTIRTCTAAKSWPARSPCPRSASRSGFRIDAPNGVARKRPSRPRSESIRTIRSPVCAQARATTTTRILRTTRESVSVCHRAPRLLWRVVARVVAVAAPITKVNIRARIRR